VFSLVLDALKAFSGDLGLDAPAGKAGGADLDVVRREVFHLVVRLESN
jgi:hypothetical protein